MVSEVRWGMWKHVKWDLVSSRWRLVAGCLPEGTWETSIVWPTHPVHCSKSLLCTVFFSSVHCSKSVCTAFSLFSVISLVSNQCRPRSKLFCTGQNQICSDYVSPVCRVSHWVISIYIYITCSPAINVLWMFWLKAGPFVQNHSLLSQRYCEWMGKYAFEYCLVPIYGGIGVDCLRGVSICLKQTHLTFKLFTHSALHWLKAFCQVFAESVHLA